MDRREEIKEWAKLASMIISNPRQKFICPRNVDEVDFLIKSNQKYNKLEIKMKCSCLNDYVVVTMDIEDQMLIK